MHHRDREHQDRHRLVGERERQRHLVEQCQNAEHRLQGDRDRKRERTGEHHPSPHRSADIGGMQQRANEQRVTGHAVVELHREGVLEKIPPARLLHQQPGRVRQEFPVDQRPGVVDQAGAQAGDQGAQIDLHQHQHHEPDRAHANPGRQQERLARHELLRGPKDHRVDDAGEREMEPEPIVRHVHPVGEPRRHHPPADRAQGGAEPEDRPQPQTQAGLDVSRAT